MVPPTGSQTKREGGTLFSPRGVPDQRQTCPPFRQKSSHRVRPVCAAGGQGTRKVIGLSRSCWSRTPCGSLTETWGSFGDEMRREIRSGTPGKNVSFPVDTGSDTASGPEVTPGAAVVSPPGDRGRGGGARSLPVSLGSGIREIYRHHIYPSASLNPRLMLSSGVQCCDATVLPVLLR